MIQNLLKLIFIVVPLTVNSSLWAAENTSDWTKDVGAKTFPAAKHVIKVNDFGANNRGLILSTSEIQAAIDSCASLGGGRVIFEPGTYLTGALFLKTNVNLHIDEGVEIKGAIGLEGYPEIDTRVAGIEMRWPSAIINVIGQENVAVSGNGIIHAQGRYHWERYWKMREEYTPKGLRWAADYDCKRVRTILVSNSNNITVEGLTLKQAGFWTVHVLYSEHVTIDGLVIQNNIEGHGPSTDGVDIDSSTKILIQNCDIDCNDDNFCLKAGRDADGLRVNKPTEFVVIRNCISRRGGGLVTFGSETSGGIRNVEVHHLEAYETISGIRFKSATTRGGMIENISIHHITMENVATPIEISLNWNPSYSYATIEEGHDSIPEHWQVLLQKVEPPDLGIPAISNVSISDIEATGANRGIFASGIDDSYLDTFQMENLKIYCEIEGKISYTKNWVFKNVNFISENSDGLILNNNIDFTFNGKKL
ncbi:MAG: glycoside hydrolase family 28 protein [Prolixibacteraceae bacterium]|nr:glycoside hydrolase family 28 protein [Prolixibacteraceae bacterium]